MSNRALEAFLELSDDKDYAPKAREGEEFLENLLNDELVPFLNAVEDFFKKGVVDFAALRIEYEVAELNLKKKGGPTKKQNEVLKESTANNIDSIQVKREKLSALDKENGKVSNMEMPAPNWIPPKKKAKEIKTEMRSSTTTRTTRTKGGKKASTVRESDVIIETPVIPIIDLLENDDADVCQTRSTRTRTRAQTQDNNMDKTTTRTTRTKTRNQKAENVNETVELETRSTRTKTLRKAEEVPNEEEEIAPRTTRTKTIRKGKNASEDEAKNSETDESQMPTRSTRTKTIRKGKGKNEDEVESSEAEEAQMPTRSTRTKTIRKGKGKNEDEVESSEAEESQMPTRSTRTKTIKKVDANENSDTESTHSTKTVNQQTPIENPVELPKADKKRVAGPKSKRLRNEEDDEDDEDNQDQQAKQSNKKSKSNSPTVNTTTQTVYEDAQSSLDNANVNEIQLNSTYIAPNPGLKPVPPLVQLEPEPSTDATIVVPRFNIFQKKSDNDLFTDDESIEPKKVAPKSGKEVFSPYERSTIKKKVEAFEKLHKVNEVPKLSAIPRSTRDTPVKDKLRLNNTPLSKFMPTSCSTSKVSRLISSHQLSRTSSNDSLSVTRAASAQKDPREKQRKMLEREQALKKKEAMLLAQAEAKKKLNEEKQLKALQQRKIIEAEKLKLLEIQKQKEERHKQRELEREEYNQKQKLELEKKRAAQKKKIQELQDQRKAEQEENELKEKRRQEHPIYMITEAPRLPTDESYDSDDPDYTKTNAFVPSWRQPNDLKIAEFTIKAAGQKLQNTFYCVHAQTIDLAEIFQNIDKKKLQRNSSRLWRKAPRYTMMANLNETKFSEDELDEDSDD